VTVERFNARERLVARAAVSGVEAVPTVFASGAVMGKSSGHAVLLFLWPDENAPATMPGRFLEAGLAYAALGWMLRRMRAASVLVWNSSEKPANGATQKGASVE
jgi:hypothetical protein